MEDGSLILWPTTREFLIRGIDEPITDIEDIRLHLNNELKYLLHGSHFDMQNYYVECWFEARAMLGQFKEHTKDIVLRPFGGFAGIEYKYRIAKELEELSERFQKPIKILYFGDCDEAGKMISYSAVDGPRGLRKWCEVPFDLIVCGLTKKQARHYKLPANPDKPGEYQWESLEDGQAAEIIGESVGKYVDQNVIEALKDEEEEALSQWIINVKRRE